MARNRLPKLVKASVVVHTRDAKSISGVLVGVHRDALAIAHATYLMDDGRREQLAGDVLIPRANVSFLQLERGGELG